MASRPAPCPGACCAAARGPQLWRQWWPRRRNRRGIGGRLEAGLQAETLQDVEGALAGIAHRYRLAGDAEAFRDGAALGLRYHKPLTASWPRQASFGVEVMALHL